MKMLKRWQQSAIKRLLVVCFAAVVMLSSTACGAQANTPQTPNPSVGGQGMYPAEDTTRDTSAAATKTKAAVDQAEARRRKVDGLDDYVDTVEPGEKAMQQAKDFGNAVKESAQDAIEDTREDFESIPDNVENAIEQAKENAEKTT